MKKVKLILWYQFFYINSVYITLCFYLFIKYFIYVL